MKPLVASIAFLLSALCAWPAAAKVDWRAADAVVGCFPGDVDTTGSRAAGPPFRLQGPLKPPIEIWPRPRRTCGPSEVSFGGQVSPGNQNETLLLDLDVRVAPRVFFFSWVAGTHLGGEVWLFHNMPLGLGFIPPIPLFGELFAVEVRGLLPTASFAQNRIWGLGLGLSTVRLLTRWLEARLWLGPDHTTALETDTKQPGFTAQGGLQLYPLEWVSLSFDQRLRAAGDASEYFPAVALRGAYGLVAVEIGSGVRVPTKGGDAIYDAWLRLVLLLGS